MGIEVILVLGLLLLVVIYLSFSLIMKSIKFLALNALAGIIILFLGNLIGLGIPYSTPVLLICAILGAPGAIAVILMKLLGLAF